MKVWVGLPGFTLDMPSPLQIGSSVNNALKMLYSAGMPSTTPVFFAGHSLGSIIVQDWLNDGNYPTAKGLIVSGGYIQRKYLWPSTNFSVPTLTAGGELDGQCRVTRLVESLYTQVIKRGLESRFPVIILRGHNHWQFAGEGNIPLAVKNNDLVAEIDQATAWKRTADVYNDYLASRLGITGSGNVLASYIADTKKFAQPVIAAYEKEGARYWNAPAQYGGPNEKDCVSGVCNTVSQAAKDAQIVIAGDIPGWTVQASNNYADFSQTSQPQITSYATSKSLNVATSAQGYWDLLDSTLDGGSTVTSANELDTKLASRQCILVKGANYVKSSVPFSVDDQSFCSIANANTYKWALSTAETATRSRFNTYGTKYEFGADVTKSSEFLFKEAALQYNNAKDSAGNKIVSVDAPSYKTSIDANPACNHYCKLLSPARAMEWIYVDSLRDKRTLG